MTGGTLTRIGRMAALLVVVGAVTFGGLALSRRRAAATAASTTEGLTCPVTEGTLVISVTESGTVKPRETTVIISQLEGSSTILYLIPEGRRVKAGDLLVELDATRLVDQRVDQEISVRNAEASFIRSRENLEVVRNQAKADQEKADLTLRFAHEDLKNYNEGDYPNQRREMQARIALAEEDVQRSAEKLKWSQQLFDEKYLSGTELQADTLAAKKAALDLELAQSNLKLLEEHTYKRRVDQLTSDVAQAEMALERVRRKTAADVVQAEADLAARDAEFTRQKGKLQKLGEQIEKAKIKAPTDGVVVFATSAQFSWRGNVDPLAEGQQVRERQELIHLPLADTFMAVVKIHESSLKKIYPGLPVRLTIDAVPGREFTGTVTKIAPLPDQQSVFMNPDLKVFQTEINIEGGGDVLRTGMTCSAEIVVARYEKALSLPVQCVVRVGGKPTVYVVEGGQTTAKQIEIGLDNNRMVHVLAGLSASEKVLLTPPLGASGTMDDYTPVGEVVIPPRPAQETRPAPEPGQAGEAGAGEARGEGARGRGPGGPGEPRRRRPEAESGAAPGGPPAVPAEGARAPEAGGARPEGAPSAEAMQKMRERFEKMTPEEREAARKQWAERRQQPAPAAAPGGQP